MMIAPSLYVLVSYGTVSLFSSSAALVLAFTSVGRSVGRKLLCVFPLTNAQLDEAKNVVEWFGKCEA